MATVGLKTRLWEKMERGMEDTYARLSTSINFEAAAVESVVKSDFYGAGVIIGSRLLPCAYLYISNTPFIGPNMRRGRIFIGFYPWLLTFFTSF